MVFPVGENLRRKLVALTAPAKSVGTL